MEIESNEMVIKTELFVLSDVADISYEVKEELEKEDPLAGNKLLSVCFEILTCR